MEVTTQQKIDWAKKCAKITYWLYIAALITYLVGSPIFSSFGLTISDSDSGTSLHIGSPLFGITALIGLGLAYVVRKDGKGTYLESHFRAHIRTFWLTLAYSLVMILAAFLAINVTSLAATVALSLAMGALLFIWLVKRFYTGLKALHAEQPITS